MTGVEQSDVKIQVDAFLGGIWSTDGLFTQELYDAGKSLLVSTGSFQEANFPSYADMTKGAPSQAEPPDLRQTGSHPHDKRRGDDPSPRDGMGGRGARDDLRPVRPLRGHGPREAGGPGSTGRRRLQPGRRTGRVRRDRRAERVRQVHDPQGGGRAPRPVARNRDRDRGRRPAPTGRIHVPVRCAAAVADGHPERRTRRPARRRRSDVRRA